MGGKRKLRQVSIYRKWRSNGPITDRTKTSLMTLACLPSRWLYGRERLVKIGKDVINVLYPDREANIAVGYAGLCLFLRREL